MRVVLTARARQDLREIFASIAPRNRGAAVSPLARLHARTRTLSEFPEIGAPRPTLAANARALVEEPYLLLYVVEAGRVRVVRVVHGARDITADMLR